MEPLCHARLTEEVRHRARGRRIQAGLQVSSITPLPGDPKVIFAARGNREPSSLWPDLDARQRIESSELLGFQK